MIRIFCLVIICFLNAAYATEEVGNQKEAEKLFEGLTIGAAPVVPDRSRDWVGEAIQAGRDMIRNKDFEGALESANKVLAEQPTYPAAEKLRDEAKRGIFWRKYGQYFVLGIFLIIFVPIFLKVLEQVIAIFLKKKK
ncbi:MAG: hypothetical protein PHW04_11635 [Candidatus Wallbacteria bacterium]|nr:hypothetical protein [Candidatus Wallbacteria bacterium]